MIFSNKIYDILKYCTTIVLPAIGSAYFALAGIWGFPNGEAVIGTIAVLTTFLGALLGISNINYKKTGSDSDGSVVIENVDDISGSAYLTFDKELDDLVNKDRVVLDVLKNPQAK